MTSSKIQWRFGPFYHDVIGSDESDYMRRWYFRTPFGEIRIHNIIRPDAGRFFHDHPGDMRIWILRGGYTESVFDAPSVDVERAIASGRVSYLCVSEVPHRDVYSFVARYEPSWQSRVMPNYIRHRIIKVKPGTWTLVVMGRRKRTWGFWDACGNFTPYTDYAGDP